MISIPGAARIKALRRDRVWMLRCMCYAFLAGGLTSHAPADGVSSSITFYPGFGPIYYEDGDLLRAASWSCFSGYTDHRVVDWCGWHGEQTFDFPLDSGACSNSWTRLDGGPIYAPAHRSALHEYIESATLRHNASYWVCECEPENWPCYNVYDNDWYVVPLVWQRKPKPNGTVTFVPPVAEGGCGSLRFACAGTGTDRVQFSGWYRLGREPVQHPISVVTQAGVTSSVPVCGLADGCDSIVYHVRQACYAGDELCSVEMTAQSLSFLGLTPCAPSSNPWSVRNSASKAVVMGVRGVGPAETVIERQSFDPAWGVRWQRILNESDSPELIIDGLQSTGCTMTGSDTPVLRMTGFSEGDVGTYLMLAIPPSGLLQDAIAVDAVELVDDVDQPRFITDLQPMAVCGATPVAPFVDVVGGDGYGCELR